MRCVWPTPERVVHWQGKIIVNTPGFPIIRHVGLDGLLVTFAETLTEPSNRAALAFREAVQNAGFDGVEETSTSLASAYVRFDPLRLPHARLETALQTLLDDRNWYDAPLPAGRRLWQVPTVYGTDLAPQLDEAAEIAGVSTEDAINQLSNTRVRVLTIGFAPGQPYIGPLAETWNIPRQSGLTPRVPEGALVLAIRQFVLFTAPAPTGWRHVGQTAFRCYRPGTQRPFALSPGDEMMFVPVSPSELTRIKNSDVSGDGGAQIEEIPS